MAGSEDRGTVPKRKREAQPDEQKVRKLGFHSRQFKRGKEQDLAQTPSGGLSEEIAMLRLLTRRLVELTNGVETIGETIEVLQALGLAASRLGRLLKTQKDLGKEDDDFMPTLSEVLGEIMKEWGRG